NIHFTPLNIAVQQKEAVTVRLEEGMVLDCLCPWDGNLSMVSWTKVPNKDPVAVFHPEYGVAFSHQYRERIEFLRTTPMDGSISMRNVTHQDIGLYHCSVQTFPQGPWTRNIQVEDLEVTVADTELVAEQNNNLTIRCNHQHSGIVSQVILEKMLHGETWRIIGVCKKVEGGLVGEDYSDRGQVNCADSLDVSLHMTDVVQEDSGFYRCTFNTDAGVKTTSVQLTVTAAVVLITLFFLSFTTRWIQPVVIHDVYLHWGGSCWTFSTHCHPHSSSEAQVRSRGMFSAKKTSKLNLSVQCRSII
uniref:CD226 molecule n=1 Tax=Acanthochromis polyacanthus TaxID=80966 RepID=A0A3Q1F8F4_9TELE